MSADRLSAACKKGFGDYPRLRSSENAKHHFFGEKIFRLPETVRSVFSRQGRSLCPIVQRSETVCFASAIRRVQNRYWVNSIYSVYASPFPAKSAMKSAPTEKERRQT